MPLRGQNLATATAHAKVLNFASNLASLAVFIAGSHVVWAGSHAMIRGGTRLIRPMIVTVCCVMIGRYMWQKGFISLF